MKSPLDELLYINTRTKPFYENNTVIFFDKEEILDKINNRFWKMANCKKLKTYRVFKLFRNNFENKMSNKFCPMGINQCFTYTLLAISENMYVSVVLRFQMARNGRNGQNVPYVVVCMYHWV